MSAIRGATAREIAARVLDVAPEALKPSWARSTWEGAFGSKQLFVALESKSGANVRSLVKIQDGAAIGTLDAWGDVYLPGGEREGLLHRGVSLDRDAHLKVSNFLLELSDRAQGSGFAGAYTAHQLERYAAAGVDDVVLTATMERGGYVWARQGFELAVQGATGAERDLARAKVLRGQVDRALADGRISATEHAGLKPRLMRSDQTLPADPLLSVGELADMPVGRKVLENADYDPDQPTGWAGRKLFGDGPPTWWSGMGMTATDDAARAVRVTRAAGATSPISAELARRIIGVMPEAYDTGVSLSRIEARAAEGGVHMVADRARSAVNIHLPDRVGSGGVNQWLVFRVGAANATRRAGELAARVVTSADGKVSTSFDRMNGLGGRAARAAERAVTKALAELDWGAQAT